MKAVPTVGATFRGGAPPQRLGTYVANAINGGRFCLLNSAGKRPFSFLFQALCPSALIQAFPERNTTSSNTMISAVSLQIVSIGFPFLLVNTHS